MGNAAQIAAAHAIAAALVARDGAAFLPVFMRLEQEMAALDAQAAALARAAMIAQAAQGMGGATIRALRAAA